MQHFIRKLRIYLTKNKIFFEVIVSMALSFMAIYVSIQANKIAENQTRIMEEELLPQLEIRPSVEFNQELQIYDNTTWLFYNHGGKLSNFNTEEYSFIKIIDKNSENYDTIIRPLYSYLDFRGVLTGESEGLIYLVDNHHHGNKEMELRNSLINEAYIEIHVYVQVSYKDLFNKEHYEYFQISPGIKKVSKSHWEKAEKYFNLIKVFSFPTLQSSDIRLLIEK